MAAKLLKLYRAPRVRCLSLNSTASIEDTLCGLVGAFEFSESHDFSTLPTVPDSCADSDYGANSDSIADTGEESGRQALVHAQEHPCACI